VCRVTCAAAWRSRRQGGYAFRNVATDVGATTQVELPAKSHARSQEKRSIIARKASASKAERRGEVARARCDECKSNQRQTESASVASLLIGSHHGATSHLLRPAPWVLNLTSVLNMCPKSCMHQQYRRAGSLGAAVPGAAVFFQPPPGCGCTSVHLTHSR
jgi:hypothetical protein